MSGLKKGLFGNYRFGNDLGDDCLGNNLSTIDPQGGGRLCYEGGVDERGYITHFLTYSTVINVNIS